MAKTTPFLTFILPTLRVIIVAAVLLSFILLITRTGLHIFDSNSVVLVLGLQALNHVLRRTVPVKSRSQSVRKYVRTGGVRTALKDFFTLDPRNSKRTLYDIYDESKMVR